LPEFGTLSQPKSDESDFGWERARKATLAHLAKQEPTCGRKEMIAGSGPLFPDCYLQWMAPLKRAEPQARAVRRDVVGHRGREPRVHSDASYQTYCHAKAITITTTAVNRPSCAQTLAAKLRPSVLSLWIVMADDLPFGRHL
jgi:hypothetical protein